MQRGGSQIHDLVREGNLDGVRAKIAKGSVDINEVDITADNIGLNPYGENTNGIFHDRRHGYGETPLTVAAQKGYLGIVKELIAANADVNKAQDNGLTPLIFATLNGHLEIVKALIAAKADVNSADDEGYTPLIVAAQKGYLEIVKELIAAGADVNKGNAGNKYTPLSMAFSNRHREIVKVLIAAGANVRLKDTEDLKAYVALLSAAANGTAKGGRRKTVSKRR
jgi:ankyrin repeat protein